MEKEMSNNNQIRASFDPKYLRCLLPFMAKADIRYYLCGICIEKAKDGGVYLIACDGHTMVLIHDTSGTFEGDAENVIFKVGPGLGSAATKASKTMRGGLRQRVLLDGKRLKIATSYEAEGDFEVFVQAGNSLLDGKFPNWRKVVPHPSKLKAGAMSNGCGLNAYYIARLSKLSQDRRFSSVFLWQEDSDKPVVARIEKLPELVAVIMPTRHGDTDSATAFAGFPFDPVEQQETELEAA
jgi:hypothetical protein